MPSDPYMTISMEHELHNDLPTSMEVSIYHGVASMAEQDSRFTVEIRKIDGMSIVGFSDEGVVIISGTVFHVTRDCRKLYIAWKKYLRLRTFALFN